VLEGTYSTHSFIDLHVFYYSTDPAELQENCQATLQSFNLCMFHEPDVYAQEDPRLESYQYLDDDMVFKLVVICMATIHLLQLRGNTASL